LLLLPLCFCLLYGCTTAPDPKTELLAESEADFAEPTKENRSLWFKDQEHVYWSNFEEEIFHPFFDYGALLGKDLIKAFVVTPKGSDIKYGFDLVSGQVYNDFRFCPVDDIKKKYSGTLHRPEFSFAIVPRLLDHLGQPQEIIIFGNPKYEENEKSERGESYYSENRINLSLIEVKVIGASVLKYCPKPSCYLTSDWKSKLILIGATSDDESYNQSFEKFTKSGRYEYLKYFMENMRGHYEYNNRVSVSYNFEGLIDPVKALQFSVEQGHLFKEGELLSMKNSCLKMYDQLWNDTQKLKGTGKWRSMFMKYIGKHKNHLSTCLKYVSPGSINKDYERHWFYAYLKAMILISEQDYFYLCEKSAWIENPRDSNGRLQYNMMDELKRCSSKTLEDAFESSVVAIRQMQLNNKDFYKYLTYDFGYYGTHKKIYSWVPHELHKRSCSQEYQSEIIPFPRDLRWSRLDSERTTKKFEIIK
jgi:hypothetical protein